MYANAGREIAGGHFRRSLRKPTGGAFFVRVPTLFSVFWLMGSGGVAGVNRRYFWLV
jgi:hypothetical protein